MKYIYVFLAGGAVVIALSWLLAGDAGVSSVLDDAWYRIEDWTRSRPLYCDEVHDPDDYRRAMDHLARDFRAGKDIDAICAE